ncbi:MAG: MAPEG family protein [Aquincola sp.]|nr:MAPEG family protein [Aquincola sp.]|tara:strand:- start:1669 stop:2013 length:345 start_codon:yes stop_codon:yes gene_type:complete
MVSSGRFHSAADNRGSAFSAPSPSLAIKVAFLQNTLEQATMAVGIHLALASLLTGPALFSVPAAVALFGVGRVAFLKGYPKGAGARSFGMATTAIPTVVGCVWTIGLMVLKVYG